MNNNVTASDLLDVLRSKLWTDGAYAWLYEVADATGSKQSRWADAVVCSCWPSRGLYLSGIETKISRSDWIRERDNPRKSAAIQQYCQYWWLVTTPGCCLPAELPETWGLIEINGKHKVIKEAPRLSPIPPSIDLLASMLRNAAKAADADRERKIQRIVNERCEKLNKDHEELYDKYLQIVGTENLAAKYRELVTKLEEFHNDTGIDLLHSRWEHGPIAPKSIIELSRKLLGWDGVAKLRKKLESFSEDLKVLEVDNPEAEKDA